MNTGLVSVVIPTYNRAALLNETLQSVIGQIYRPIECIVVDDGSTDHTAAVIETLRVHENDRFALKYIVQDRRGSQMARNTGTAASSGEFIQYLDSDDLLYPDKLSNQVDFLNRHPQCDGVYGDWRMGSPENNISRSVIYTDDTITDMLCGKVIVNFAFLMRRSLISRIPGWDTEINRHQEVDFHLQGLMVGGRYCHQEGLTGLWRHHNEARVVTTTGVAELIHFSRKWERELSAKGLFTEKTAYGIACLYLWHYAQEKQAADKALLRAEVARLCPFLPFQNNWKMNLLRRLLGQAKALEWWIR